MSSIVLDGPGDNLARDISLFKRNDFDTGPLIIPDNVRLIRTSECGCAIAVVHEVPAGVHSVRWNEVKAYVAVDIPSASLRRISLPHLIFTTSYIKRDDSYGFVRVFLNFLNKPLTGLHDILLKPHILNVQENSHGLHEACLGKIHNELNKDINQLIRHCVSRVSSQFFSAGFNSDMGNSLFESNREIIDPRVATIDRWVSNTQDDPELGLKVKWKPSRMTLSMEVDRAIGFAHMSCFTDEKCSLLCYNRRMHDAILTDHFPR